MSAIAVPNPIDVAEGIAEDRGWLCDKDLNYLVAQVEYATWSFEISLKYRQGEGVLHIHCDYASCREVAENVTTLLCRLIVELNEVLPFGYFTFSQLTGQLGFKHVLFVDGVSEDAMEAHIDFVLTTAMEMCAIGSPLFEHVMDTASYPERHMVNFVTTAPEGTA